MVGTLLLGGAKILLLGVLVLHVAHVVMTLQTKGLHYRFRFDPRDPVRSAGRFLVWLGVQAFSVTMAGLSAVLDVLEDASADVGEWAIHRKHSIAPAGSGSRRLRVGRTEHPV